LCYAFNPVHKIQEHINYMYHWMSRLAMSGVYKFFMERQMLIVLLCLRNGCRCDYRWNIGWNPYILTISLMKCCLRGNISMSKMVYNALEEVQVIWMLLLNSFHDLSIMNLEKMTLMKWMR
jgi:hypothetical protein